MTVALNDVVVLRDLFVQEWAGKEAYEFGDWKAVSRILHKWHWRRKPLASTINILSVALYDLFGADGSLFSYVKSSVTLMDIFLSPLSRRIP